MRFAVNVEVTGLEGIADPEGRTIERALPALGFVGVHNVRVGKLLSFELESQSEDLARSEVEKMCAQLLSNPIIERASIVVRPLEGPP